MGSVVVGLITVNYEAIEGPLRAGDPRSVST